MNPDSKNSSDQCVFPPKDCPIETVALKELPETPLVSVVVPSWNQGQFIGDTIRSILSQEYRPLEIIVMDGGSTDETVEVLQSFEDCPELTWVSEPDKGVVDAVNKGFSRVNGDIVAIQSSDDMYAPNVISSMVKSFQDAPDHGLIYGDTDTVDADGQFLSRSELASFTLRRFLNKQTYIPQPSAFFRRELLDECGGWDKRYFGADTQFWLRMVFRTQVKKIDKSIALRRLHDEQRDNQAVKIMDGYERMIDDSPEIAAASRSIQKSARAGVHMHWIRYLGQQAYLRSSLRLWRAMMLDHSLWQTAKASPLLVPGWLSFRVLCSRLKQSVRGKS